MAYFKINDQASLYYEEHGKGRKTIIFVNGLAMFAQTWVRQIEFFRKEYRVIVYDQRCQGRSVKENESFHYSRQVDDLKLLMEHLKVEKGAIIGVSYGSFVAKEFAVRYPALCEKLVLLAPLRQADFGYRRIWANWRSLLQKGQFDDFCDVILQQSYSRNFFNGMEKTFFSIREEMKKYYTCQDIILLLESFNPDVDLLNYGKIKVPSLVIGAKQDYLHNCRDAAQIAAEIAGSRLVLIDSGHAVMIEQANAVNDIIAKYLLKKK